MNVQIGAYWSSWCGTEDTHCTDEQLAAVESGSQPLPPDARVAYGVDKAADAPVKVTIGVDGPEGHTEVTFDPTGEKIESNVAAMQGQDHGWFKRSRGWNGIFHVFPRREGANSVSVSVTDANGDTANVTIPWFAKESEQKQG